jgi:hypothetical protein
MGKRGNTVNTHRIFVGQSLAKRLLGRPRSKWKNNIVIDVTGIDCEVGGWIKLAQDCVGFCTGDAERLNCAATELVRFDSVLQHFLSMWIRLTWNFYSVFVCSAKLRDFHLNPHLAYSKSPYCLMVYGF